MSASKSTVAAGGQAGGNWIYGGPNAEIGMVASGIVKDAGYNLATGIAEMSLKLAVGQRQAPPPARLYPEQQQRN